MLVKAWYDRTLNVVEGWRYNKSPHHWFALASVDLSTSDR